jgi:transposase
MANTTKNMQQIRHILQLRAKGFGIREIRKATGISRPTIRTYLKRWDATGLPWNSLSEFDDGALAIMLYQEVKTGVDQQRLDDLQTRIPRILQELSKIGVTRRLLWEEYRQERPDGYGYTQFCEYLGGYAQQRKAVMHLDHKAGERLMIDFAGKKLHYVDIHTGEQIACEVFVAVLPFSGYCYVEAVRSQCIEDFIGAIANAFNYLGGVPQSALIDNLKSGVIKPDRYEPILTDLLEQLSAHYGCTFMTTRVAKPRDKASVERHVQIIYQRIYAHLRNEHLISLQGINDAILTRLIAHHAMPLQNQREECRQSLFDTLERLSLMPLPATPFEVKYSACYKVQKNYHVQLGRDRHFYSVPHTYIGKQVQIIYTRNTVEIYNGRQRIAFHHRDRRAHAYSTVAEHMPPNHQHYAQIKGYSAQYFLDGARKIGPNCLQVITYILEAKIFQQQAYNSCLGLLRLADKYTQVRLEHACARVLRAHKATYGMVANILKHNLDQLEIAPDPNNYISQTPKKHHNLRNPDTFQ